jgi:hypothetical protein
MHGWSRFVRFGLAGSLAALMAGPVLAQAKAKNPPPKLTEQDAKEVIDDLQDLADTARQLGKQGGRVLGRSGGAKIAGPLGALTELLTEGPTLACAFWRMSFNRHLEKLAAIVAEDPSPENLEIVQEFQRIMDRVALACDRATQDYGTGGAGSEPEGGAEGEGPQEEGPPHDLTPEEKACWPLCRDAWHAVDSAIEGVRLRAARLDKAQNEAVEAEKMLQSAQDRLRQAEQDAGALEQFQKYARRVDPVAEAKRRAADRARTDARNDVLARQGDVERARAAATQAEQDFAQWLVELTKRRAAYRECLKKCAVSASQQAGGAGSKKWLLIGGAAAVTGGAALAAGGSSGTSQPAVVVAPSPGPSPPPVVDPRTGTFGTSFTVSQNPGRHPNLIAAAMQLFVSPLTTASRSAAPIRVRVTASDPAFIPVEGTVGDDGRLAAGGNGRYAGFNTAATLELTITASGASSGRYSIGTDGGLPTGQPIAWAVSGARRP